MIPLLIVMCALQVITLGAIALMLARLTRLEVHVIELKTWQYGVGLRDRRDLDELEKLRVRSNDLRLPWRDDRYAQSRRGTIQ